MISFKIYMRISESASALLLGFGKLWGRRWGGVDAEIRFGRDSERSSWSYYSNSIILGVLCVSIT